MSPLGHTVQVPWNGKTYPCQLTNGRLARAEMSLNIGIISPSDPPFSSRPIITQYAVYLYALMYGKPFTVTLDDCLEAIVGDNGQRLMGVVNDALQALVPDIERLAKNLGGGGDENPLASASGGADSTPLLASSSESVSASSGD
jgi:hypothetical protein